MPLCCGRRETGIFNESLMGQLSSHRRKAPKANIQALPHLRFMTTALSARSWGLGAGLTTSGRRLIGDSSAAEYFPIQIDNDTGRFSIPEPIKCQLYLLISHFGIYNEAIGFDREEVAGVVARRECRQAEPMRRGGARSVYPSRMKRSVLDRDEAVRK